MSDPIVIAAGIAGLALVLATTIHAGARLRIEQQRTLQKLLERGDDVDAAARLAGIADRGRRDMRRGATLVAIGLAWSAATFVIGGPAWRLGAAPVLLGLVLLALWKLDERK